jgi:hypothetical protein
VAETGAGFAAAVLRFEERRVCPAAVTDRTATVQARTTTNLCLKRISLASVFNQAISAKEAASSAAIDYGASSAGYASGRNSVDHASTIRMDRCSAPAATPPVPRMKTTHPALSH